MKKSKTTITSYELTAFEVAIALREFIKEKQGYSDDINHLSIEITPYIEDCKLKEIQVTFKSKKEY